MELGRLIAALSDPAAYGEGVASVVVHQTHISAVFLAGPFAYKVKKPFELGFLDYSTLERRRHFCREEVRLNNRLAHGVYVDVVPITIEGERVRVGGRGEPIEWAVKMVRLPEENRLGEWLHRDEVGAEEFATLARRLARFHAGAESGAHVAESGRFEVVAANARENFTESEAHVGRTIHRDVFERLRTLTEGTLASLQPLIQGRAERFVPRDGHGDLRLDHVYRFPEKPPPGDLIAVDCIEFNERFRHGDPVADVAFLVMDLIREGRRDLAQSFADAYFQAAGDEEGRDLLPFYTAYRAAVRGKVEGIEATEPEVPESERRDCARPGPCPLAAGAGGVGDTRPAAGPCARRGLAWHREIDPRGGTGRAGAVPGHPIGRRPQGAGRPRERGVGGDGLRSRDLHSRVDETHLRRLSAAGRDPPVRR